MDASTGLGKVHVPKNLAFITTQKENRAKLHTNTTEGTRKSIPNLVRTSLLRCMQILIMSFPDKYHVHTLEQLLDTCLLLQPGVEIDSILSLMVHRITEHASSNPNTLPITDRSAFTMLLSTARECGIRCCSNMHIMLRYIHSMVSASPRAQAPPAPSNTCSCYPYVFTLPVCLW